MSTYSKQSDVTRKYVTETLNSLSSSLLSAATHSTIKNSQAALMRVVSLVGKQTILICGVSSGGGNMLKHSITALKFVEKIRDIVIKKLSEEEVRLDELQVKAENT